MNINNGDFNNDFITTTYGVIKVDNTEIKTIKQEISSACILSIEVGTNCPRGGDAGHGGVTVIKLVNEAGGALSVKINPQYVWPNKEIDINSLEIILRGDAEAEVIAKLLKFAGTVIEKQLQEKT